MSHEYAQGVPIDTDVNLAADSDAFVPSQRAVKTFIENSIADAIAAIPPSTGTGDGSRRMVTALMGG